jgi:hypothetical protein
MTTATANECPKTSPWGPVQHATELGEGCYFASTAGHGGVKLSRKMNADMPDYMRQAGGWYEEDCDWALAVCRYPQLAQGMGEYAKVTTAARDTMKNWHPHEYARFFGVSVESLAGQSFKYDEELFDIANADKLVVTAAWGDWHENVSAGMVGVLATRGGSRTPGTERVYVEVTAERYAARSHFGYVIQSDEPAWCGPDRLR